MHLDTFLLSKIFIDINILVSFHKIKMSLWKISHNNFQCMS